MTESSSPSKQASSLRWFQGMILAAGFCLVYFFAPLYIICAMISFIFAIPSPFWSYVIAAPLILSLMSKPTQSTLLVGMLSPMADYFQYEEAFEFTDQEFREQVNKGKKFIIAFQPHGILSFCTMCAAAVVEPDLRKINTAAASALLKTPILKNVMGIFGLVDASKPSLKRHFQNKGIDGCIALYVGGIAELFKSSRKEERLYLKQRKGFIKLAMQEGVDVVPTYLFGNTSVLTVLKSGPLAWLSRKLQVSLTYFWGKYYLPIPRNEKVLYARGKPLGLPHQKDPTREEIEFWHDKYCSEVARLFEKYKEKVPAYKRKKLYID